MKNGFYKKKQRVSRQLHMKLLNFSLVSILVSANVFAIDFNYTIFSTVRNSDNLNQRADSVSGESINSGGTFSFVNEARSSWFIDVSGSYSKEYFSVDELPAQTRSSLAASATYTAPKSNFEFLIRDDFSQAPRNRFATQEVGNLVDVNIITARPSYYFNITPIDQIYTEITYLDSTRDNPNVASDELGVIIGQESFNFINIGKELRYEKTLNATSNISLVFDSIDTRFAGETGGVDFVQDNYFLRWVGRGKQNQLQVEVGQTSVVDENDADFKTTLFNLLYNRQITPEQNLSFSIRNGVNFTISQNFINDTVNVDGQQGTFGGVRKIKAANIIYTLTGDTFSGDAQLFLSKYASPNGSNNESRKGLTLSIVYSMSQYFSTAPQTNLTFGYQQNGNTLEDRDGVDIENDVKVFDLQFNYFARPTLSYFISLQKRNTSSTNISARFASGDSNSVSIGFVYAPLSARSAAK